MKFIAEETPSGEAEDARAGRRTASLYSVRSQSPLECSLGLAEFHVRTLPVSPPSMRTAPAPGKSALLDEWPQNASIDPAMLQHWFGGNREVNLGMLMGSVSGLIAFDIDAGKGGFESWDEAERKLGLFPLGPRVRTGSGGLHIFAKYPEGCGRIKNDRDLCGYSGVDFKADHGYVVGPPSRHVCGEHYQWVDGLALGEIDAPHLPEAWLHLILRRGQSKPSASRRATSRSGAIPEGARNDTLFRRACAMRAQGAERDEILEALLELNLSCVPPMEEGELAAIANSAAKYAPNIPLTDLGNARRLVAQHGQDIRFCIETGKWLVWTGQIWSQDHNA